MSSKISIKEIVGVKFIGMLVILFPILLNLVTMYMTKDGLADSTDIVLVITYNIIYCLNIIVSVTYFISSVIFITFFLVFCVSDKGED